MNFKRLANYIILICVMLTQCLILLFLNRPASLSLVNMYTDYVETAHYGLIAARTYSLNLLKLNFHLQWIQPIYKNTIQFSDNFLISKNDDIFKRIYYRSPLACFVNKINYSIMDYLRCVMADHESKGNPIIGICIDKNCQATQRILCVTCQKKYHNTCQRDSTLEKDELLEKLRNKFKDQVEQRTLEQLRTLRVEIKRICDQLEKDIQILENNQRSNIMGKIQEYSKQPFTMKIWNECYLLLDNNEINPEVAQESVVIDLVAQIQSLFKDLSRVIKQTQFDEQLQDSSQNLKTDQQMSCLQQYSHVQEKSIIQVPTSVLSIDCSPCGKYITCAASYILISFDLLEQKQIAKSKFKYEIYIRSVRYSPSGKLIASCSDNKLIIIWDASTLNRIGETLQGHEASLASIAFSPDSLNLISGSWDQSIRIWDIQSQQQVGESINIDYQVLAVEYSHNGLQFLSAGGSGNIDIWDSKTRQPLVKLVGHESFVNTATYSFDDRYIVSGSDDRTIKIWDAITGKQIHDDLVGHENEITSVALTPDSRLIVSGSQDNTVRLWDFQTGKQEALPHTHSSHVNAVRFSTDGRYVISGSSDTTICLIKIRYD